MVEVNQNIMAVAVFLCMTGLICVVVYINLPSNDEPTIVAYNGSAPADWTIPKNVIDIDYMIAAGGLPPMNLTVGMGGWGISSPPGPNDATNVSEDRISFRVPPDCKNPSITNIFTGNYKPSVGQIISFVICDNGNVSYEEVMGDDGYNTYWRKVNQNNLLRVDYIAGNSGKIINNST